MTVSTACRTGDSVSTHSHDQALHEAIRFGTGLLNDLHQGDSSHSTAVELQSHKDKVRFSLSIIFTNIGHLTVL